jgi:ferredoxin-nitrite reductase
MNLCPSLSNPVAAKDGNLSRLRIPGGILNFAQCQAIANLTDELQITNRTNLQIRNKEISADTLRELQNLGLAASNLELDSLRNILCSPTAGIDSHALINVLPLVKEWNDFAINQPHFSVLSSKFSVGFDGGESVSIGDRSNDLLLAAEKVEGEIFLRLYVGSDRGSSPQATKILIKPDRAIETLAALTEVYCKFSKSKYPSSPRLRELIAEWGVEEYLAQVAKLLPFCFQNSELNKEIIANTFKPVGIHHQSQAEYAYIGIVIPLGRLSSSDFLELAAIAQEYSQKKEIRLTAWQTLLIPSIHFSNIEIVKTKIEDLGYSISSNHPYAHISACIGSQGCKSSATDTQVHAQAIASHLVKYSLKALPLDIHISGCSKFCANYGSSNITLLGIESNSYQILLKDGEELINLCTLEKAIALIEVVSQSSHSESVL